MFSISQEDEQIYEHSTNDADYYVGSKYKGDFKNGARMFLESIGVDLREFRIFTPAKTLFYGDFEPTPTEISLIDDKFIENSSVTDTTLTIIILETVGLFTTLVSYVKHNYLLHNFGIIAVGGYHDAYFSRYIEQLQMKNNNIINMSVCDANIGGFLISRNIDFFVKNAIFGGAFLEDVEQSNWKRLKFNHSIPNIINALSTRIDNQSLINDMIIMLLRYSDADANHMEFRNEIIIKRLEYISNFSTRDRFVSALPGNVNEIPKIAKGRIVHSDT
ncbi:predicted protein [Candida tropicalis MYA-3404]|uniref:Uncharacterized protein n=1 Tax=Candida tropicalis (strain ATCC MYA-3404 / T1) TaxID=294747 RepID=C5M474_CANTT|nr:predicted protein [Candida tropicalis MYA-3404]EER36124.1 predicted protein [Candida tropicalis MYA-3404]KAG4410243.1 hypothetical protein JTP64_000881 [Candida tropicalis]